MSFTGLEAGQDFVKVLSLQCGLLVLELAFKSFHPEALVFVLVHLSHVIDRRYPEMTQSICKRCKGLAIRIPRL